MWGGRGAHRPSYDLRHQGLPSSGAFEVTNGRDNAELLHHAQSVIIAVGIHYFPVGDVVDRYSVNRYILICRGNSQVLAFVGTGHGPASNYFIPFGNQVLDGPAQIGVACQEAQNLALVGFWANGGTRNIGGLDSVAGEMISLISSSFRWFQTSS